MTARMSVAGSLAIVVLLGLVTVRNALDVPVDRRLRRAGVHHLRPRPRRRAASSRRGLGVYHTPPGYPAVAGALVELGERPRPRGSGPPGPARERRRRDRHLPARSSPRADALAGETGRLAGCHGLLRLPPRGRESGSDVPSRAARDARDGRRAPRPRAHGSRAPVRLVARGLARAAPRSRAARSRVVALDGRGRRRRSRCRRGDRSPASQAGADGTRGRRCCSPRSFPPRGTCTRRRGIRIRSSTARSRTRSSSRAGPLSVLRGRAGSRRSFAARGRDGSTTASGRCCTPRRGATTSASGRGGPVERREPMRSTRRCRVRASSGCCRRLSRSSESWRFSASR